MSQQKNYKMKQISIILLLTLTQLITSAQYTPGIQRSYFEGSYNKLTEFTSAKPINIDTVSIISHLASKPENYAYIYKGLIKIDTEGSYTFFTSSDDGSSLYIDSVLVVTNDGLHSLQERSGTRYLTAGYHSFEVQYFNKLGGSGLTVSYSINGVKKVIPDAALFLKKQLVMVVDDSRIVFLENVIKDLNTKFDNLLKSQQSQGAQLTTIGTEFNVFKFLSSNQQQLLSDRITIIEALPKAKKVFLKYPLANINDTITIIK